MPLFADGVGLGEPGADLGVDAEGPLAAGLTTPQVGLEDHFAAAPAMRPVFDAYLAAAERNGPVTVNAT